MSVSHCALDLYVDGKVVWAFGPDGHATHRLAISTGNLKTGKTPGINMTPVRTCPGCTGGCGKDCYALKAYRQYAGTRTAWDCNADVFETDPMLGFHMVAAWLDSKRTMPEAFRWHSAGDFVSARHFDVAMALALRYPTVRFFAYTKNRDLLPLLDFLPDNLVVRVSMWVDLDVPTTCAPLAWYQDGTEDRAEGVVCPATKGVEITCDRCKLCSHTNRTVQFIAH